MGNNPNPLIPSSPGFYPGRIEGRHAATVPPTSDMTSRGGGTRGIGFAGAYVDGVVFRVSPIQRARHRKSHIVDTTQRREGLA